MQSEQYLMSMEVRAAGDPTTLANAARNALRESEPGLAVGTIETFDSRIVKSIVVERVFGWLTMAFWRAALGLACLSQFAQRRVRI